MMNDIPNRAKLFVGIVVIAASAFVAYAIHETLAWHNYQALTLLVIAIAAARLRVRLPGLTGNMSVNVPFILIAVVHLSLIEALFVGIASTISQCFPKDGSKPKAIQMLFNVSTVAVAVGMGTWILRHPVAARFPWASASLMLSIAATTFFLAQTVSVATIISMTEGGSMARIWSSIFHLSFPYYVLSAGVTSIVTTASRSLGWKMPLIVLAVMYGVYRSYCVYFGRTVETRKPMAFAKSASC